MQLKLETGNCERSTIFYQTIYAIFPLYILYINKNLYTDLKYYLIWKVGFLFAQDLCDIKRRADQLVSWPAGVGRKFIVIATKVHYFCLALVRSSVHGTSHIPVENRVGDGQVLLLKINSSRYQLPATSYHLPVASCNLPVWGPMKSNERKGAHEMHPQTHNRGTIENLFK